jgi:Prealbumin-like fold domain
MQSIKKHRLPLALAAGIFGALLLAIGASALAPPPSLSGSNFEIDTDANLRVDNTGADDWASVTEIRATDKVNGTGDNSYSGGVKENTVCPSETTDSIPPNKSDLLSFHVYREAGVGTHPGFLNLAWSRVSEPEGPTLMDFEFNQSSTKCTGSPNVVRTAGDLLLEYSIDQGGARADITGRTWTGTQWGAPQDLDVNSPTCGGGPCASGTINSSPIPAAQSDGLIASGSKEPRTFGEAQLDLRLLFQPNKCTSFGSAMLKSRSSDAFTSQLKDFVAPVGINLQNCGQVIIRKQTNPEEDPNTTQFGYTKSFGTDPVSANTFTLTDDGVKDYGKTVLFGSGYTVVEDVIPSAYAFTSLNCGASTGVTPSINGATVTFAINDAADILDCTYTNTLQRGALSIVKNSTKGGLVEKAGAVFSYDGSSVTDNGAGDEDPTIGEVCVSGLQLGDYDVTETSAPPGYGLPTDPGPETVTVVTGSDCTNNPPTGSAVVTFTDPPLADIQVNYRDGGSGETSLTSMSCTNTGTTGDTTPATGWDDSVTHEDIRIDPSPRTVTCEIVIDP